MPTRTAVTRSEGSSFVSNAPVWLIECTIKPRFAADAERVVALSVQMVSEGIHVEYSNDAEGGGLIAKIIDEQHLDTVVDILQMHKVELKVAAPRVAYRETLARVVEVDYTHKKQVGGGGQFARVKLRLEPNEAGAGNEFQSKIVGGIVPSEYIPGVDNVVADLNIRRGHIRGHEVRANATMFRANAPLARLFGYKRNLAVKIRDHGVEADRVRRSSVRAGQIRLLAPLWRRRTIFRGRPRPHSGQTDAPVVDPPDGVALPPAIETLRAPRAVHTRGRLERS